MKKSTHINWTKIYKNESRKLLALCRRYTGDTQLAEDLVHESFIKAIQSIDSFENKGSLEGWLRQITINTALNYLRTEKKQAFTEVNEEIIKDETLEETSASTLQDKIINASFSRTELLETIDNLPTNQKTVFNLFVIEGFSHKEISDTLEISENLSKTSLSRARKKIQSLLEEKVNDNNRKKKKVAGTIILSIGGVSSSFAIDSAYHEQFNNYKINPSRTFQKNLFKKAKTINSSIKAPSFFLNSGIGIASAIATTAIIGTYIYTNNNSQIKNQTALNAPVEKAEIVRPQAKPTTPIRNKVDSIKITQPSINKHEEKEITLNKPEIPEVTSTIETKEEIKNSTDTKTLKDSSTLIASVDNQNNQDTTSNKKVVIKKKVYIKRQ